MVVVAVVVVMGSGSIGVGGGSSGGDGRAVCGSGARAVPVQVIPQLTRHSQCALHTLSVITRAMKRDQLVDMCHQESCLVPGLNSKARIESPLDFLLLY